MRGELEFSLSRIDKSNGTGRVNPQHFLVFTAAPDDQDFVPALIQEIAPLYPTAHIACFAVPEGESGNSQRARKKRWRSFLSALAESLGLSPLRPGQEEYSFRWTVEHQMWDRADFIIVDYAERLDTWSLHFLRRDYRGRPPVLLVTRDDEALQDVLATDSSLARRAWGSHWTPPGR